jgi:hypothetical protein
MEREERSRGGGMERSWYGGEEQWRGRWSGKGGRIEKEEGCCARRDGE